MIYLLRQYFKYIYCKHVNVAKIIYMYNYNKGIH